MRTIIILTKINVMRRFVFPIFLNPSKYKAFNQITKKGIHAFATDLIEEYQDASISE